MDETPQARLGDLIRKAQGRFDPDTDRPTRYVGADHIDEAGAPVVRWGFTTDSMFPPTFRHTFGPGDVLLHSRNPKKVAVAPFSAVTGEKLFVLRSKDPRLLDSFLYHLLLSDDFQVFAERQSFGSTNRFLNWSALVKYEFPLPSLARQQTIVDLLDTAGEVVHESRKLLPALTKIRAVLSVAVAHACEPTCSLGDVASVEAGLTLSPARRAASVRAPYIRAENLKDGVLDFKDLAQTGITRDELHRLEVKKGDVLLIGDNADAGKVGLPILCEQPPGRRMAFQNHVLRVRSRDPHRLPPVGLYYLLNGLYLAGSFQRVATGTSIKHLRLSAILAMQVPSLPSNDSAYLSRLELVLKRAGEHSDAAVAVVRALRQVAWHGTRET